MKTTATKTPKRAKIPEPAPGPVPEDLPRLVRDLYESMYPGQTDEDLLNRPTEKDHFCNIIRVKFRCQESDHTITGYLINGRKRGGQPYGKPHSGVRLELALKAAGVTLAAERFREVIADVFHGLHRGVTPEEMLRQPREGKIFCDAIRENLKSPDLPDRLICATLGNLRREQKIERVRGAAANKLKKS